MHIYMHAFICMSVCLYVCMYIMGGVFCLQLCLYTTYVPSVHTVTRGGRWIPLELELKTVKDHVGTET